MTEDEKRQEPESTENDRRRSGTLGFVQVETLEQIAERLGWSPERLAEAQRRAGEPTPLNITDRDRARAEALSKALKRTRRELDEAS